MQSAIAKEGRALLLKEDHAPEDGEAHDDDDGQSLSLNTPMVEFLMAIRAKYLLSILRSMMVIPNRDVCESGESKKKVVTCEDMGKQEGDVVLAILSFLLDDEKGSVDGQAYIVELETRFRMKTPDSNDMDSWATMWFEVLRKSLLAYRKSAKLTGDRDFAKLLPPTRTVITKSLFRDQPAGGGGEGCAIKLEQGEHGRPNLSDAAEVPAPARIAYFETIYTASDSGDAGSELHALDVIALQSHVQQQLLMHAG